MLFNGIFTLLEPISLFLCILFVIGYFVFMYVGILNNIYKLHLTYTRILPNHPFEIDKTFMDTFLFNSNLLVTSTIGLICFFAQFGD